MAGLALVGALVSGIASAAGAVVSAQGQADASNAQAAAKDAEAQAQLRKGLQENAVKQREAADKDRQFKTVLSNQQAGFASSGGGVGTGSALTVATDTASRGILGRDASLWEGAEAQAGRQNQANVNAFEADSYRQAAKTQALSGVISGVSGVFGAAKGAFGGGGGATGGSSFYYG